MVIKIDYSALDDTACYMRELAGSFGQLKNYGQELNSSLNPSLREWALDAQEPYGHSHVEDARTKITEKKAELDEESNSWADYAKKIDTFSEFAQDKDKEAAECFSDLAVQYTNYKGLKGVFQFLGDTAYNLFAVDFANSNDFTRNIAGWLKEKKDDISSWKQNVKDYFKHGNGKYVLNILIQSAKIGIAVLGIVGTILAAPWTGGTSLYATVAIIGFAASCVAATCTTIDGIVSIRQNVKVLNRKDIDSNPGMARFYGDTNGVSSWINKNDLGGKVINDLAQTSGKAFDFAHSTADAVSMAANLTTSLGATTTSKGLKDINLSKDNILHNIAKSFGVGAVKNESSKMVYGKNVELANNTGNISESVKVTSYEQKVSAYGELSQGGKSTILSFGKGIGTSEYVEVVASDGKNVLKYSEYIGQAKKSTVTLDITNILAKKSPTTDQTTLQKVVNTSKTVLTTAKGAMETLQSGSSLSGYSVETVIKNKFNSTNLGSGWKKYSVFSNAETVQKYYDSKYELLKSGINLLKDVI